MSARKWTVASLAQGLADAPWRLIHDPAPRPLAWMDDEPGNPTALSWHSDGTHFATGDQSGGLSLWRCEGRTVEPILRWRGHEKTVKALCWMGDRLISGGRDATIAMWDGEVLAHRLTAHHGTVNGLAVSPAGDVLLSAADDRTLCCWDVATGATLEQWVGHQGWVTCVAMHPSGRYALTGSSDANLVLWCLADGTRTTWHGHVGTINAVVFSPDGKHAASASADGALKVWEVESGKVLCSLRGHEGGIHDVIWVGERIVTAGADFRVGVWGFAGVRSALKGWLQGHRRPVLAVGMSGDGQRTVSGGADRAVGLWDVEDAHPTAIHHAGSVRALQFSPGGDWLASGSRDETVWVRDVSNGQRVLRLVGHEGAVQGVAFSPTQSQTLLSISTDGSARLWDLASGRGQGVVQAHGEPICACAWSNDGQHFFTGSRDGTARIWAANTLEQVGELKGHENWVRSLAVHADGSRLLMGSYDGTVTVWNWHTQELLSRFSAHVRPDGSAAPVTGVAILPGGQVAVSGGLDGMLRLWTVDDGQTVSVVNAHTEGLVGVVVHENRVLSAAMDRLVKQWRFEEGTLQLDHALEFGTELDSLALHGVRMAVGDRAGHTFFFGTFKQPLRLDGSVE